MIRKLLLLSASLFLASLVSAQHSTPALNKISGSVANGEQPLYGVNVSLLKAADSSLSKITSTDKKGNFEFESQEPGRYLIKLSFVGYKDAYLPFFDLNFTDTIKVGIQQMAVIAKTLGEVVVSSKKPLIEVRADKMIFNVENSINAVGNNALELLRRTPGVTVTNDDNISLKGKNGVNVYIDGKPTYLSPGQLSEYLRSLNSSNIESIEIISNPGARYDAAGSAGIINIRLKKNQKIGFNGSLSAGFIQGVTPKTNNSVTLNYRSKKISWFGLYNNSFSVYEKTLVGKRMQSDSIYEMNNYNTNNRKTHYFKTGLDLNINSKSTIGLLASGNLFDGVWINNGVSYIKDARENNLASILESGNRIATNTKNLSLNVNYKYADSAGRALNVDVVRGFYKGRGVSNQPNTYRDPKTDQVTGIRNFSNNLPVDIDIYTARIDYEMPFKKGKLEAGIKSSYVASDNKFELYNEYPSTQLDVNRSNRFKYKENINAAYTNYNFPLSKQVNLQAGLRLEQTASTGDLSPYNNIASKDDYVKRKYLDLFPSTAITWKLNDKNTLNLTYSRRIDRPSYQDLNPFENKLDELTYDKGNAFLKPQYTNNFELTHNFRGSINTSLNYTIVNNYIALVNDTIAGKAVVISPQNLKRQELYGIVINANIPVTKWMGIYWYGNFNRRNIQHSFSPGKLVNLHVNGYTSYLQTNFDLGKGYSTEVSGWVVGGGLWGVFKQTTYGSCDVGFQKKLFSNKANIKLSFNDIFFTTPSTYTSNLDASYMTFTNRSENRAVKLTFTLRFGRTEVKGARDRKTGSETESGRIKPS